MGHSKRNILQEMNMTRPSPRLKVHSTRYWKVHKLYFTYSKRKEHSCIRKKWQQWAMENNDKLLNESLYIASIENIPTVYICVKNVIS